MRGSVTLVSEDERVGQFEVESRLAAAYRAPIVGFMLGGRSHLNKPSKGKVTLYLVLSEARPHTALDWPTLFFL